MKKSRWTLIAALGLVLGGLGLAGYAYWTSVAAQGSALPGTVSWVPAGAEVVAHVNMSAVSESPLRGALRSKGEDGATVPGQLDPVDALETTLGIRPFEDIDAVSLALLSPAPPQPGTDAEAGSTSPGRRIPQRFGFAVQGRFDAARILDRFRSASVEGAARADVSESLHEGTTIYERRLGVDGGDGEREPADGSASVSSETVAIAFPEDGTLIAGSPELVRAMLDAGAGRAPSAEEKLVTTWGEAPFAGESFWIAGNPAAMGVSVPAGPGGLSVPPVQAFALAGRLDQELSLRARGRASDSAAAQQLADVLRGLIAFANLQERAHPELGELVDSVAINQVESEVLVSVNVPYEMIRRALAPSGAEEEHEPHRDGAPPKEPPRE